MSELLQLALVQFDIQWKDPQANLNRIAQLIDGVEADLFVLPEMFATGFIDDPNTTDLGSDLAVEWMLETAQRTSAAFAGSLAVNDGTHYFNRLYVVTPEGTVTHYDKRHLFALGDEAKVFSAGNTPVVAHIKDWSVNLSICYDLRFPAWARYPAPYDVYLCVANWPAPRIDAWDTLLKARAIENQCFSVGVNRVGSDPKVSGYPGHSQVFDPMGSVLSSSKHEGVQVVTLNKAELNKVRSTLPYLRDKDIFEF